MYNHDAEMTMLAGVLRNPDAYWAINTVGLIQDDFIGVEHRRIMRALNEIVEDKKQPDIHLVVEELLASAESSTIEYANRLLGYPASIPQAADSARTVKGLSTGRQLAMAGARIVEIATEARADTDDAMARAESELRRIRDTLPVAERSPDPGEILRRMKSSTRLQSIPIRFIPTLNDISGGLIPGHLWVVGGFSSTGKSAVACNIVSDCIHDRKWVGLVSTEMTQEAYTERLLAIISGVKYHAIRDRVLIGQDATLVADAEKKLSTSSLRIFDTLWKIGDIRMQAQRMKETTGLDVLLVDFLQNVRGSTGDFSFSDLTEITLDLQQMAKDLRITVVAFSQVSNEMAKWDSQGGDSNFYTFKGSGAIRDASDFAIMLKRDRVRQSPILDFHVMKNRWGELRVISTHIDLPTGRIEEITPDMEDDE